MNQLDVNKKIDVKELLKDLENYRPKRRGWTWREKSEKQTYGPFEFSDMSTPLKIGRASCRERV